MPYQAKPLYVTTFYLRKAERAMYMPTCGENHFYLTLHFYTPFSRKLS